MEKIYFWFSRFTYLFTKYTWRFCCASGSVSTMDRVKKETRFMEFVCQQVDCVQFGLSFVNLNLGELLFSFVLSLCPSPPCLLLFWGREPPVQYLQFFFFEELFLSLSSQISSKRLNKMKNDMCLYGKLITCNYKRGIFASMYFMRRELMVGLR